MYQCFVAQIPKLLGVLIFIIIRQEQKYKTKMNSEQGTVNYLLGTVNYLLGTVGFLFIFNIFSSQRKWNIN